MAGIDTVTIGKIREARQNLLLSETVIAQNELKWIKDEFTRRVPVESAINPFIEEVEITVQNKVMSNTAQSLLHDMLKGYYQRYKRKGNVWVIPIIHSSLQDLKKPDDHAENASDNVKTLEMMSELYERINTLERRNADLETELKLKSDFLDKRDKDVDRLISQLESHNSASVTGAKEPSVSLPAGGEVEQIPPLVPVTNMIKRNSLSVAKRPSITGKK